MKFLSFVIVFIVSTVCFSQDTREIVLSKGQKFQINLAIQYRILITPNNQKYTKEINVNYSLLYELTVENNTDNIFTLSNVLIKAKASMIYDNEEIIYNSEKPNPTNQLTKRFDEVLNEPSYYTFQNGCCIKRKKDDIKKKNLSYLTGSPDLEMFNEFVESLFIALPNDLKLKTVFNSNTTIIPSDSDNAYIQFKTESIKGNLVTLSLKVIEENNTNDSKKKNNTIPSNFKGKAIVDINSGLIKKMNCKISQKETFSQEGSKFLAEIYMKLNWTAEEIK